MRDWHEEMAVYLKSIDPRHLVSTSVTGAQCPRWEDSLFLAPAIDFTQFHHYTRREPPTVESVEMRAAEMRAPLYLEHAARFGKPVFAGEIGESGGMQDSKGIDLHNRYWGDTLSGGAGAPASWEWHLILGIGTDGGWDTEDEIGPLAEFLGIANGGDPDFSGRHMTPVFPEVSISSGPAHSDLVLPAWCQNYLDPQRPYPYTNYFPMPETEFTVYSAGFAVPDPWAFPVLATRMYGLGESLPQGLTRTTSTLTTCSTTSWTLKVALLYSDTNQKLKVTIDSQADEVTLNPGDVPTTRSYSVSAGSHVITVENSATATTQNNNFTVTNCTLAGYVPALRVRALRSDDKILAWVHNRQYNWVRMTPDEATTPTAVSGTIHLTDIAEGDWDIEWINPHDGTTITTDEVNVDDGTLDLELPCAIEWDIAVRLTKE